MGHTCHIYGLYPFDIFVYFNGCLWLLVLLVLLVLVLLLVMSVM